MIIPCTTPKDRGKKGGNASSFPKKLVLFEDTYLEIFRDRIWADVQGEGFADEQLHSVPGSRKISNAGLAALQTEISMGTSSNKF